MTYEPGGSAGELLALLECSGPLTRSDLVVAEGKEVTEFQLEAQSEVVPARQLQTVPLSIAVH